MTYHAESIPEQDDAAGVPQPLDLTPEEINNLFALLWEQTDPDTVPATRRGISRYDTTRTRNED